MKQTWKRIISLLFSVCMVMTLLPTVAFAEDEVKASAAPVVGSGAMTATAATGSAIVAHSITASAGAGGSISPNGAVSELDGNSQTFTIMPDSGHIIATVTVDGIMIGAEASYTFSNVTADHTISATFTSEQFALAPGGTYYFDLSAQGIPGTINTSLPDTSLKWVPFTYVGTINAYSRTAEGISTHETVSVSDRSLFVASRNVRYMCSWSDLNDSGLIFGKNYNVGGVNYTLRSLSAGSRSNGQTGDDERAIPETNEYDQVLNKNEMYIDGNLFFVQDTIPNGMGRILRGIPSLRSMGATGETLRYSWFGFCPVLEVLNPSVLGSDGLKTVTFNLGGNGTLGTGTLESATVVYTGTLTLPEITEANGFKYTGTGTSTLGWYDTNGGFYASGAAPTLAAGTTLTAGYGTVLSPHSITVQNDGDGIGSTSPTTATKGMIINLSSTANSGYHFKEWQVVNPASLTITGDSFTMPDEAVIVKAIFEADAPSYNGGSDSGGGYVSGSGSSFEGTEDLSVILTRVALQSLVNANTQRFEINGPPVSLVFDLKALQEIQTQSTGDVTIRFAPVVNLSSTARNLIGTRPVYNVTITYVDKNGKIQAITSLNSGTVTLSIPYTPGTTEAVGYLFGVYVDGEGNATRIAGSIYDANSRSMLLGTNHFSVYGVGYTSAPSAKFTDISTHWANECIDYVVSCGLLEGSSETSFSPDTAMTRGMLMTALGRLADVEVHNDKTSSFTDAKADSSFLYYIKWAYKKGIVKSVGNGKFAPGTVVTREEIAMILLNYAKATGFTLPVTREAAVFADSNRIGGTYKNAVKAMQQAGIMMGKRNNRFNPQANVTRAEFSAILHRYIKLTIDAATAQGWAKNDDGQYLYYKDGKAFTGWRDIGSNNVNKCYYFTKDGIMIFGRWREIDGKWYYFNADGSLAVSTKIDEYEVDEDGVRVTK